MNKCTNTSKTKGNAYERKVAKQLSLWMYYDHTILYKHENSGARKANYFGDIIPKDLEKYPWESFPFSIEVKNGYKEHIPTFCGNQRIIRSWILKLLSERNEEQNIPILICQFHHKSPIFISTLLLNYPYTISIAQEYDKQFIHFYVYSFKEILQYNFYELIPKDFAKTIKWRHSLVSASDKVLEKKDSKKNIAIGEIVDQILF